jgi:hypothetical protein
MSRRFFIRLCIVLAVASSTALAQDAGPRLGTYAILQATGTSSNIVGQLVLKAGGIYEVYDMLGTELRSSGKYRYDADQKRVAWLDGINYEMGRGGTFSVQEGGKHRIMLGSKTYAINPK